MSRPTTASRQSGLFGCEPLFESSPGLHGYKTDKKKEKADKMLSSSRIVGVYLGVLVAFMYAVMSGEGEEGTPISRNHPPLSKTFIQFKF